ncbi:MAG TPA: Rne/Rng family ribonuclease [Candidatus Deferrimicrobiaceae bacterium]|nr:Rne/Rng family ribonuclease [Candidatus Deferrimicrobiaceae bacterium]
MQKGNKLIVINSAPYETRVATLESGILVEFLLERGDDRNIIGNIYKGRVIRVLPGMQAAFVDIGMEKAGFLYAGDFVTPRLDFDDDENGEEDLAEEIDLHVARYPQEQHIPPIEGVIREGQLLTIQVAKEPLGTKGARITTHITLPGRYLVLLTWSAHIGISRRIEDPEERERLHSIVGKIRLDGMGAIVRTAAEGKTEGELKADMDYLVRHWDTIRKKGEAANAPILIHRELSLPLRAVRDLFTADTDRIVVDSEDEYVRIRDFASQFFPRLRDRIELYQGTQPIFEHYGIEIELARALDKKVWLKSGGYIVIEQTEALTVIDVNTGKYVGRSSLEETTVKINLEAVKEIVYQLRLRNIGGIIIIDFIDMKGEENREKVYQALVDSLRADRSKTTICKISELGLVEMTRKRVRESLARSLSEACPYCSGEGIIKSKKTICYEIFRAFERQAPLLAGKQVSLNVHPALAEEMFGEHRRFIEMLENRFGMKVNISASEKFHIEQFQIEHS